MLHKSYKKLLLKNKGRQLFSLPRAANTLDTVCHCIYCKIGQHCTDLTEYVDMLNFATKVFSIVCPLLKI